MMKPDRDEPLVPARPILILEQHQIPGRVDAGGQPCALQRHQRDERVHARRCDRRRCHEAPEPQRLETEILPDQILAGLRPVPLVEHEVEDFEHRVEPCGHLAGGRHVERQPLIANLPLRAHEPLRDRRLVGEERSRDLAHAEAADGLQAERHARVARQRRMTAHDDHAQLVVPQLFFRVRFGRGACGRSRQLRDDRVSFVAESLVAADRVDGDVVRDAEEPPGGIVRRALVRPRLERADHRLLHRLLGERDVSRSEQPCQAGHHAARLMPEQVFEEQPGIGTRGHDRNSCLTSIVPPYSRCG